MLNFNPKICRNEREVESKLIVHYLLPELGYSPETWHQEVAFGSIRLDFLAFAAQYVPFVMGADSPLSVVIEAKHPKQNLDHHVRKLRYYLSSLLVRYGLLTNGRELRIYERGQNGMELVFRCTGEEISDKIGKIKSLVGRENAKPKPARAIPRSSSGQKSKKERKDMMKIIAVYHNKGGVGKTTVVVNLAAALSRKGKRVLVVDLDSQANTTFGMGLIKFENEEDDYIKDKNIQHVLKSKKSDSIQEITKRSQFNTPEADVVPSHINLMQAEYEIQDLDYTKYMLGKRLKAVEDKYDIVLIDTPPSLGLFARIALIAADYLIIPSDLKPFANQGLRNVINFIEDINTFKDLVDKNPISIIGVLPSKISPNPKFRQYTLPKRIKKVQENYGLPVMDSYIFERAELGKCTEEVIQASEGQEIPNPVSIFEYDKKNNSQSCEEFEALANEVMQKIGVSQ